MEYKKIFCFKQMQSNWFFTQQNNAQPTNSWNDLVMSFLSIYNLMLHFEHFPQEDGHSRGTSTFPYLDTSSVCSSPHHLPVSLSLMYSFKLPYLLFRPSMSPIYTFSQTLPSSSFTYTLSSLLSPSYFVMFYSKEHVHQVVIKSSFPIYI